MIHETHSRKGAPALILLPLTIEKVIPSKLVGYIPGIVHGPLVIKRESLPVKKPYPEMERLRIPDDIV